MIGVLASSGSSSDDSSSQDDTAVLPISTAQQLTGATTDAVSTIYVEGRSEATLGAAYAEITSLLLNLHDVSSTEADFTVTSQESLLETANSTNRTLTVLLGGIAAISLLVGGIGVMNIMLVSVTERIREIGLRKALGATPAVIRRQFLVEASLLGLAGGLIGVLIGAVGAQFLPEPDQPAGLAVRARRRRRRSAPPSRSASASGSTPPAAPRGSPPSTHSAASDQQGAPMKKTLPLVVVCAALGLALSACGSGQDGGQSPAAATQQNGEGGAAGGGPGGGFPGGSGKVAAVTGSTAQVQGQSGQVAVTWTAKTTFTQQVSTTAKALKVGDCVVAMPSSASSGDTSDRGGRDRADQYAGRRFVHQRVPRRPAAAARAVAQRTHQQAPPEGAPSGAPSDGARRGGFGAFGKVTAVSGTGFTVESARPGSSDTSSVSVTTTSATTWTTSAKATSKDVKVGRCVNSVGRPDSTGAITATSIAVSQPVNGQCAVMFGGPGMGRPGGETQNS